MAPSNTSNTMRTFHRYLGFFLAGIMTVYAISGIVLIFRDTSFLKQDKTITKSVKPNASAEELGQLLDIRQLKVKKDSAQIFYFNEGSYDQATGTAIYVVKELPLLLDRMTHLHKAKSSDPLFFLNIFFGVSLFFFVVSAFWMFMPETPIFRKGMYFTLGGIILVLLLLLI
jgi:hypothetical protein